MTSPKSRKGSRISRVPLSHLENHCEKESCASLFAIQQGQACEEPINSELSQASKGLDPHGPASMDGGGQGNTPLR